MLCDDLDGWDAGSVGGRSKREGIIYIDIYRCIDRSLSLSLSLYIYIKYTHTCTHAHTPTHTYTFLE